MSIGAEYIIILANLVFTAGTALLFQKILKNRNVLKDFDLSGSLITAAGSLIMAVGYFEMGMFGSILSVVPTLGFWLFVSVYTFKNRSVDKV